MSHKSNLSLEGEGLSPLVIQGDTPVEPAFGSTVVLRHSDEMSRSEGEDDEYEMGQVRGNSSSTHHSPRASGDYDMNGTKGTADKAGVILGIHNVFLVLPQFIVTVLSSVIFWLMEPSKSLPTHHPGSVPVTDTNTTAAIAAIANSSVLEDAVSATMEVAEQVAKRTVELVSREGVDVDVSSPDAVGLIFRIGGVSAAVGGWICWRLARDWARGQGV